MNLVTRIVLGIVKLALVIGLAGGLIDLTQTMRDEAVKAHKQGIVSLKQLNSSLVGRQ
jgi:hypothetical protein